MFHESMHKVSCSWESTLRFCSIFYDTQCVVSANFAQDARMEWICIKFCVNLGKSATETLEIIKEVFREQSMSCTYIFEWHASSGQAVLEDNDYTGRPIGCTMSKIVTKIQHVICEDKHLTWWNGNWLWDMPTNFDSRTAWTRALTTALWQYPLTYWLVHQDFTDHKHMNAVFHPPYPSVLASCNFALFPNLKIKLKGCRFKTIDMMSEELAYITLGIIKILQNFNVSLQLMKPCTLTHQTCY